MRLTGLLALLLFFLIVFAAPAASYGQSIQTPTAVPDSRSALLISEGSPPVQPPRTTPDSPEVDRPIVVAQPLLDHGGDMVFREYSRDDTCYTMRTYVMASEDKDSDIPRMVRYRKCLPGWQLNLKRAIAPVESDRPR